VKTTIDIPEPLYRQVKLQAIHRGVSLRELVLGALEKKPVASSDTACRDASF